MRRGISSTKLQGRWRLSSCARSTPSQASRQAPRDPGSTAIAAVISVIATIFGLLFLAWLVLFVTKGRFLKHTFERVASRMSERDIKVAGDFNFYFDPIATRFKAEGITVSNPAWASKPNLFAAKLVDTRVDTWRLLFGTKHIQWITLVDGAVDAEWDAQHDVTRPPRWSTSVAR